MDCIPYFEDGDELTCTVITTAVTGKMVVKIAGDKQADGTFSVTPAGAGDRAFGIAMMDAVVGQRVTVHRIEGHEVMPLVTASNLAANVAVKPAAGGTVTASTAGDVSIGVALTSSVSGADGMIALGRLTA